MYYCSNHLQSSSIISHNKLVKSISLKHTIIFFNVIDFDNKNTFNTLIETISLQKTFDSDTFFILFDGMMEYTNFPKVVKLLKSIYKNLISIHSSDVSQILYLIDP